MVGKMDTKATEVPRAWVGCLACYNDGRLVGSWMDGEEAGDREAWDKAVAGDFAEGSERHPSGA
jgi:hypothetical protein